MRVEVGGLALDLTDAQVAELRRQLAAPESSRGMLTAAEVAQRFNVSTEWCYRHAAELGAVRLGDGPRGRLRFDAAKVEVALVADSPTAPEPPQPKPRRRRTRKAGNVRLLAIRGENPYAGNPSQ